MTSISFDVPDMSCGHCVSSITQAVKAAAPGADVQIDLGRHRVVVSGTAAQAAVQAAITDAGYTPALV
jgi:copper chaperone